MAKRIHMDLDLTRVELLDHMDCHNSQARATGEGVTHVFMIHVPQQLNFSQSAFRIDLIVECIADLLDGNLLASLRIDSRTGQKEYIISSNNH